MVDFRELADDMLSNNPEASPNFNRDVFREIIIECDEVEIVRLLIKEGLLEPLQVIEAIDENIGSLCRKIKQAEHEANSQRFRAERAEKKIITASEVLKNYGTIDSREEFSQKVLSALQPLPNPIIK